ncbi:putative membrane protein [Erwinia phage Hena1]|jgi:hypothetical protein|uniref:Putative membrane protein n=1 Tax=Erwinia phage Hena1 TaxID=2678601 RepID=A0A6B9J5N9_9CAUD|nr:hypothetical protein HWC84_gp184 [Erwinia phage Hena1]QGZ16330.1 putative membrane protein [Erwinia phage Hena1]
MRKNLLYIAFGVFFVFCVVQVVLDAVDTYKYDCTKNGIQRMVNTIDGLMVEDQLVCKDGRTKWSRQYN